MDLQILLAGIPSLLSGILLYEYKRQTSDRENEQEEKLKRHDAVVKGVEALLRDRLIQGLEFNLSQGYATISTVEAFTMMYSAYSDLGGNGIVTHMYKSFLELPHVNPDEDTNNAR